MTTRIDVIVSQGQSQHPSKRQVEEDLIAALMMEPGIDVTVVPHLYDLDASGTGILALQGIAGDMVVISWLFSRAAQWTLDRHDIRGRAGQSLLDNHDDDRSESAEAKELPSDTPRVIDERPLPPRSIHCLDLRWSSSVADFVEEVKRIARESATPTVDLSSWIQGKPTSEDAQRRFLNPTNSTALGSGNGSPAPARPCVDESADRRWYPVIDFSRCTNCMECIDFCLFGVYGVDDAETILVEQPDNCRKGCPACSRVCPENAIMFPQHKTPAIAGAAVDVAGMKIDLSQLFGGGGEDAAKIAAQERDEQLTLAGREAVGMSVGMPKRQADRPTEPKDKLDDLIDALDDELEY